MNTQANPESVHAPLGAYSHTVDVPVGAQWLAVSGQVGVSRGGRIANGFQKQAEQALRNVLACLKASGMGKRDLVKMTVFLTDARQVEGYRAARSKVLGDDVCPASTLLVIAGLASPDLLVEIEAWAAR